MPTLDCACCGAQVEVASILDAAQQTCPYCSMPVFGAPAVAAESFPGERELSPRRGRTLRAAGAWEWGGTVLGGVLGGIIVPLIGFYCEVEGPPFVGALGGAAAGLGLFETRGQYGARLHGRPLSRHESEVMDLFSTVLGAVLGYLVGRNVKEMNTFYLLWGSIGGLILGAFFGKMLGQMVGDYLDYLRERDVAA